MRAMLMCADILLLDEPTGASRYVKMLMTSAVCLLGSTDIQICHPPGHLDVANVSWLGDYLLLGWLLCVPFFVLFSLIVASQVGNSCIIHHSEEAGWQAILAKTLNIDASCCANRLNKCCLPKLD